MTFDNFCAGNTYKYAFSTAKSVADSPDGTYNPLIFYGPSGVGKTHLLSAIETHLKDTYKKLLIISVSAEELMNDLREFIIKNDIVSFRQKYDNADVLLIDNFELVAEKTTTQEELFLIFDRYIRNNKQIVLCITETEDNAFSEKIKSRLSSGVALEMKFPDDKIKKDIIDATANELNIKLDENEIDYILEKASTVGKIKGLLKTLTIFCKEDKHPSFELVKKVCKNKELLKTPFSPG